MSYIASPINYYRVNANNTSIATSNSGASAAPTEEIAAPVSSTGTVVSVAGTAVLGTGTNFVSAFDQGQYLFYIDGSGNYNLIGQIGVIVSNTSITLTSTATNIPASGLVLAAAYSLLTNNESVYIRIPTAVGATNTMDIPNFSSWRNGDGSNNTGISQLQQMSAAGTPLVNQTPPTNISFTFTTMNIFSTSGQTAGVTTYWRTSTDFPTFIWIKVTPQIGSSTNLASQTLFRFTTNESQPSIVISPGTLQTFLSGAGYSFASSGTGTQNII